MGVEGGRPCLLDCVILECGVSTCARRVTDCGDLRAAAAVADGRRRAQHQLQGQVRASDRQGGGQRGGRGDDGERVLRLRYVSAGGDARLLRRCAVYYNVWLHWQCINSPSVVKYAYILSCVRAACRYA